MAVRYKYPDTISSKMHLELIASNYKAPSQAQYALATTNKTTANANVEETEIVARLQLPIPGGFGDAVNATWSNENIIPIGGVKEAFSKATFNPEDKFGSIVGIAKSLSTAALKDTGPAFLTKMASEGLKGLGGIEGSFSANFGRTLAPNEVMTYKGTSHAELPLEYTFLPKNIDEVEQMVNIIDFFRNSSRPIFESLTLGDLLNNDNDLLDAAGVNTYRYPPIFDIRIFNPTVTTARSNAFFGFSFMVLESFKVSYGNFADSMTYFNSDELTARGINFAPTDAKLSLSFKAMFPNARSAPSSTKKD